MDIHVSKENLADAGYPVGSAMNLRWIQEADQLISEAPNEYEAYRLVERAEKLLLATVQWNKVIFFTSAVPASADMDDLIYTLRRGVYVSYAIAMLEKGYSKEEVVSLPYYNVLHAFDVDQVRSLSQSHKVINQVAKVLMLQSMQRVDDFNEFKALLDSGFQNDVEVKTLAKNFGISYKDPKFISKITSLRNILDESEAEVLTDRDASTPAIVRLLSQPHLIGLLN
jgi:hypothetical protein